MLWKMSFHYARGFELFHLSCELCPASSTAARCQLDFQLQSFDDPPACLWDIARVSAAMFFPDFRYLFSFGEDEDGDMETRIITLETKGRHKFQGFLASSFI